MAFSCGEEQAGRSRKSAVPARGAILAAAAVTAMICIPPLWQNRGLLYKADLSALHREGLSAPPKLLQQLLQQAAAKQLHAHVLLLHGPPSATAAAAAAAKDVLPAVVVADAEALLSLEKQQERQQGEQQDDNSYNSCRYCGDASASCECLSDVSLSRSTSLGKRRF